MITDRTRGNRHRLKHMKLHVNRRKIFLNPCEQSNTWNRLPIKVMRCRDSEVNCQSWAAHCSWPYLNGGSGVSDLQRSLPTSFSEWKDWNTKTPLLLCTTVQLRSQMQSHTQNKASIDFLLIQSGKIDIELCKNITVHLHLILSYWKS